MDPPLLCGVCSMVLRMMLPHHCPHPETGPTDERARMCPVRACAAVGRLCVRKCAADAGEPSGSGRTHPIRSIEQQRATSARPSARPRRLTASRDGPHAGPSGIFYRYSRHRGVCRLYFWATCKGRDRPHRPPATQTTLRRAPTADATSNIIYKHFNQSNTLHRDARRNCLFLLRSSVKD